MSKAIQFVLKENITNIYRIYTIAKYELVADMRDSKLGLFWNFANPMIQVLTYWFVFGFIMERNAVDGIPYIYWMLGGMVVWFYISPCITNGCNAIFVKVNIIAKMKFPVSILPTTVVIKELFNHFCLMIILIILFSLGGYYPNYHWLGLIYYLLCAVIFSISLSMTTSVLNMLARDTRKLILAIMRLILYMTPILWTMPDNIPSALRFLLELNPIYYVVAGYRDCFFYHQGIMSNVSQMISFWLVTFLLFTFGSCMLYRFKHKMIDLV